jgi:hypothetical protein
MRDHHATNVNGLDLRENQFHVSDVAAMAEGLYQHGLTQTGRTHVHDVVATGNVAFHFAVVRRL